MMCAHAQSISPTSSLSRAESLSSKRSVREIAVPGHKTIGEISALYAISLRALRFYEERGLISPLRVGSRRYYAARDEVRLRIILVGKRLNFSLREIEGLILSKVGDGVDVSTSNADKTAVDVLAPDMVLAKIRELEDMKLAIEQSIADLKSIQEKVSTDTFQCHEGFHECM